VEQLEDFGISQQPLQVGSVVCSGIELHEMAAIVTRSELHKTKAIAIRIETEGFGIYRHDRSKIETVR
jgi:hypothetical protein